MNSIECGESYFRHSVIVGFHHMSPKWQVRVADLHMVDMFGYALVELLFGLSDVVCPTFTRHEVHYAPRLTVGEV